MIVRVLQRLGYKAKTRPFSEFIAFRETMKAAKAAGVSVGDFIERRHPTGSRSATDQTIDGMASLGVFDGTIERVCELGPGSGRYLERTIARCHPKSYEIYETSSEWRNWLAQQHPLIVRACDGKMLAETKSNSVNLVQAHKLFPGLPLLVTLSYLREMARVVQTGGWIVFDIMTESCFSQPFLKAWFDANPWAWDWTPHLVSRDYTVDLFRKLGISLVSSFPVPLYPAITECMIFRKASSQ